MARKKFYFIKVNGKYVMETATKRYKLTSEQAAENVAIILYGRHSNYEIVYEFEDKNKIK